MPRSGLSVLMRPAVNCWSSQSSFLVYGRTGNVFLSVFVAVIVVTVVTVVVVLFCFLHLLGKSAFGQMK